MRFTINGRLSSLNEYTKANRSNRFQGAYLKKKNQTIIGYSLTGLKPIEKYPVEVSIKWCEPNQRRDIDNITFATKFILDTLVQKRLLEDDSQRFVSKINHEVVVDKANPRIEVNIRAIESDLEK